MLSKIEAKRKIERLVKKFDNLSTSQLKKYNEANTRKDFILPLFHALGWDVYNDFSTNEVVEEESTISGRIDYSFRLNNLTQFLLEAKAIPKDLDKEKWAHQAIEYGWNKGISWVVLTDFEGLKVFNSDWKVGSPRPNLVFDYNEYPKRFEDLWLLSRGSVEKGELNEHAKKWGITAKRVNVNEKLAEDLVKWRDILTNNLKQWNKGIAESDLEEAVQRILDRLIFIRVVEDRRIEDKILWQTYQKWETKGRKPYNFIKALNPIFRNFDNKYNSNLFQKHLCEDLDTEGEPFRKIIPQLYGGKEQGVKYRFDAIDADVLGGVYEQYLGKVQQREGTVSKRKKQGIYYTPNYIVEYIVQNTLGKLLKETPSLAEREKIKILDPACGSGSFLIKTFEVMDENLRKERKQNALRKYRILTENIYGVDLDEQAIEIARLNLLLKALVPGQKLPLLTEHMKVGNSLISDKKIHEKAFNWKKEFSGVLNGKNPGFDVIIGNPPYVFTREGGFREEAKEYFKSHYSDKIKLGSKSKAIQSGKLNLFALFLIRSINLLRNEGVLSFIIPNTFLRVNTYIELRKFILNNCKIIKIADTGTGVFAGVTSSTIILILQKELKEKPRNRNKIDILGLDKISGEVEAHKIKQKDFDNNKNYIFNIASKAEHDTILKKLGKNSTPLREIGNSFNGIATKKNKSKYISDESKNSFYKPLLEGKDIKRYMVEFKNKYIVYDRKLLHRPRDEKIFLSKEKIVTQRIGGGSEVIIAALDNEQYYTFNSINNILLYNRNFSIKYVLALLNSRLLNWYYVMAFTNLSLLTVNISKTNLEQLPIRKVSKFQQKPIIKLVDKILNLNITLQKCAKDSDKYRAIHSEIEKVGKKIDQLVYKLYSLTPEEIEIVEKNTKKKKLQESLN